MPESNRHPTSSPTPCEVPIMADPRADRARPLLITSLLPNRSDRKPAGMLDRSLPRPKMPTTSPTPAALIPKSSAKRGSTGMIIPCPIMDRAVETQTTAIAGLSRRREMKPLL